SRSLRSRLTPRRPRPHLSSTRQIRLTWPLSCRTAESKAARSHPSSRTEARSTMVRARFVTRTACCGYVAGAQVSRPPHLRSPDLGFARRWNGDVYRLVARRDFEAKPARRADVREHRSLASGEQRRHFSLVATGLMAAKPKHPAMDPVPLPG